MRLTELQEQIAKSIQSRQVNNIRSFLEEFCQFEIKTSCAILFGEVNRFYLSLDIEKNRHLCQEFVILVRKLHNSGLVELSPDKSETSFHVLKSVDGEKPAQVDDKLIRIISEHLETPDNRLTVKTELIPLPELEDFINRGFVTEDEFRNEEKLRGTMKSQRTTRTISILALLLTVFSNGYLLYRNRTQDAKFDLLQYKSDAINYRPRLDILGKPIIRKVYFKSDSVVKENDSINVYSKMGFSAKLTFRNSADVDAKILATIQTDTISGTDPIRRMLISEKMRRRKLNDVIVDQFFAFQEVKGGDTISFDIEHEFTFVKNSEAVLHFVVLYQNELGNLFDSYYWARFKVNPTLEGQITRTVVDTIGTNKVVVRSDYMFAKKHLRNLISFLEDNESSYPYSKEDRDNLIQFFTQKYSQSISSK